MIEHKSITFRFSAFSAPAGKYNPDAPLNGNEDNFYVDDDLGDDIPGRCQTDSEMTLSDCGCLMVVADGMGGMNAGEVASAKAIETVKDFFSPGKISSQLAASSTERKKYLEQVIKEADRRIKADAKQDPTHEGMGSTIILAWFVEGKVTISWCGDSRAYRYNPLNGIELLSRDHSYVQELVNKGVLRYEDTFEHPQGNIVTRSLGDPNSAARPETREFDIYNGDIILLCSDGLSGVLRDKKTLDYDGKFYPGDTIEDVIAAHTDSMTQCRDALMEAAEKADWYDNVTVLLCQILDGAKNPVKNVAPPPQGLDDDINKPWYKTWGKGSMLLLAVVVIVLCAASFFLGKYAWKMDKEDMLPPKGQIVQKADSTQTDTVCQPGDGQEMNNVSATGNSSNGNTVTNGNKGTENEKPVTPAIPPSQGKRGMANVAEQGGNPVSENLAEWQKELLQKLQSVKQEAFKDIKEKIIAMIKDATDTSTDYQEECKKAVNNLLTRSAYLSQLDSINVCNLDQAKKDSLNSLRNLIISRDEPLDATAWKEKLQNLELNPQE